MQKFPAEEFSATAKISFKPNGKIENEKAGLVIMGTSYTSLSLKHSKTGIQLVHSVCKNASGNTPETETVVTDVQSPTVFFKVSVTKGAVCQWSYSLDGKKFNDVAERFTAEPGKWIGAKIGLYCTRPNQINDSGYLDLDWFRIEKLNMSNSQ
jgi:hypothetical protein